MRLEHEFVDLVADQIPDGKLFVSIANATVIHRCCCGCGNEVVTPLGPTDWSLTYDGESISLHPSIGNWSFPCRSHYWIHKSTVRWAERWSEAQIAAGRAHDRRLKAEQFGTPPRSSPTEGQMPPGGGWKRIVGRLLSALRGDQR